MVDGTSVLATSQSLQDPATNGRPEAAMQPEAPGRTMRLWGSACRAEAMSARVPSIDAEAVFPEKWRQVRWHHIWALLRITFADPENANVLYWCIIIAPFLTAWALVEMGALTPLLKTGSSRNLFADVINSFLAPLYSVLGLAVHVIIVRHSYLLFRWSPVDVQEMRLSYCRGAGRKRHEWAHMVLVIALLHAMCVVTYVYTALFFVLVPTEVKQFPSTTVLGWLALGFPVVPAVYQALSPLSAKGNLPVLESGGTDAWLGEGGALAKVEGPSFAPWADIENQNPLKEVAAGAPVSECMNRKARDAASGVLEGPKGPEVSIHWQGGLVSGFCSNPSVALQSCINPFGTLGKNVARLQLGSSTMHALLLAVNTVGCLLIFEACAFLGNAKGPMKLAAVVGGAACTVLGFAFGAFWRRQLRHAMGVPVPAGIAGGCSIVMDFFLWLFFWPFALSQETRTVHRFKACQAETADSRSAASCSSNGSTSGEEETLMSLHQSGSQSSASCAEVPVKVPSSRSVSSLLIQAMHLTPVDKDSLIRAHTWDYEKIPESGH